MSPRLQAFIGSMVYRSDVLIGFVVACWLLALMLTSKAST